MSRIQPVSKSFLPAGANGAAKKLKISNFAIPSLTASSETIDSKFKTLQSAIIAIFTRQQTNESLESLYKLVEAICMQNQGESLYSTIQKEISQHLSEHATKFATMASSTISSNNQAASTEFLSQLCSFWEYFCQQLLLIRCIFLQVDNSITQQPGQQRQQQQHQLQPIWDLGISLFKGKVLGISLILNKTISSLLQLIDDERRSFNIDRNLCKRSISMLTTLKYYAVFEENFLNSSDLFFDTNSKQLLNDLDIGDFLLRVQERYDEEQGRLSMYLNDSTRKPLLLKLDLHYVTRNEAVLLEKGFGSLLEAKKTKELQIFYNLFSRINAIMNMKATLFEIVKKQSKLIVNKDDDMVEELLKFKKNITNIIVTCFNSHQMLLRALNEGLEHSMNSRHNKPAEMIAKFIDAKLRTANKESTEEELNDIFDGTLQLFRYIHGKDVFEAFYKNLLAKRLLSQKSASTDAEQSMLLKLKHECGAAFTNNLEGMFKDMRISEELTKTFNQLPEVKEGDLIDFGVNVLTSSYWPNYPPVQMLVPTEISRAEETFKTFYTTKHPNCLLNWQRNLASAVLLGKFKAGQKDIIVSSYQAVVLLCFNECKILTADNLMAITKIEKSELYLTLQTLACGKARLLKKSSKGKDVAGEDKFSVNDSFESPHHRIKIVQIAVKQLVEEDKDTMERVIQDRSFAVDAAIVRIMKARKVLKHNLLVSELISQLKFPFPAGEMKVRIESLIGREFMSRDEKDPSLYTYLA